MPPPHSLLPPPPPLDFIPFPNVCCAPSSFALVLHASFLSSSLLVSPVLSYSLWATPVLTAAIHLQYVFLSIFSVSRAGKGIRSALPCSVPRGLLSSHVLFILQVTTLCRWSISTSRGSWDTTSYRRTSPLSWLSFYHKSLSGSIRNLSLLAQLLVYPLSPLIKLH